jgi:AraC-like DNA-binding protein/PAS domain-containing protein
MTRKKPNLPDDNDLRRKAEERLANSGDTTPFHETEVDALRLLHELQVHHIELDMQNEELRRARDEMEHVRDMYSHFFDFAPAGYFILSRDGTINRVNLTGAGLLEIERSGLVGRRLQQFIAVERRSAFSAFLETAFTSQAKESCESSLLKEGLSPNFVHIEAVAAASGGECIITMIDITKRKWAEEVLGQAKELIRGNGTETSKKPPYDRELQNKNADTELWPRQQTLQESTLQPSINEKSPPDMPRLSDEKSVNLARAVAYIDDNFLERLKLDTMAQEAGMSKFHFCRSFKKDMGITPMQYVIALRLKKALGLLSQKNKKISTVAAESGFDDLAEFNRQFKKAYGAAPSAFRKR